ncbi:hypothetical protein VNI00_000908 [Paramarasmius palmivorus]|uniref:Uncharacterized protein n=1 Tax=Paramarasmius palmivorus TaxID=297713 RepID=A0AAW0EAY6_9AGAR
MSDQDPGAYDINDAKAVQNLLNQIGASQAWKTVINEAEPGGSSSSIHATDVQSASLEPETKIEHTNPHSVASLLSQLQSHVPTSHSGQWQSYNPAPIRSPPTRDAVPPVRHDSRSSQDREDNIIHTTPAHPGQRPESTTNGELDLRHYTFQQALPILTQLASRKELVDAFKAMKAEQDALERRLLEERNAITRKYEEKIKVAMTKASLIGSGISKHEATMLNDGYKKELGKFDRERVIPAWEGLVGQQQETLASYGVPTMYTTSTAADREGPSLKPGCVLHVFPASSRVSSAAGHSFNMPYVDFFSDDDWVSIYYTTNSPFGNVGGFDPEKPTIMMLHPTFLDSSWLNDQFGDPRLDKNFNLIAFDMRKPQYPLLKTEIPLTTRFDEMCLSLTLCNVPPPTELKWVFNAFDEVMQSWCYADDLESFEHVCMEAVKFIVGPNCDPDLLDDLIAHWEVMMPPRRRRRMVELMNIVMNRTPLKADILKEVRQPVLIIHGERNETCPQKYAERLQSELVNAEGGAILYTVKGSLSSHWLHPICLSNTIFNLAGGAGALNIVSGTATITNQVFAKFLSRLPHHRSDLKKPAKSKRDRMAEALQRLAELIGDQSIASRDPYSSLSFSCLPSDVVKGQAESLALYKKGESDAFDPTGPDGRPIRKYSEKKDEHWFQGEKDGISYASTTFTKLGKQNLEPHERQLPMPASDSSGDLAHQGRLRRATISPNAVDKPAIKGSMAKVVGSNTSASFQRMLK